MHINCFDVILLTKNLHKLFFLFLEFLRLLPILYTSEKTESC